jgi:hypothetical protein
MLDFSKYNLFYVNGCSFTEGGGLEEPKIRDTSLRPFYEKYYNVTWKNRDEINWAGRLSHILKIPVINEAICGGGVMRSVRMTYDFIYKNWKNKDKFFIILENPDLGRCDVYHKKTNSHFIVNINPKDDKLLYATRNYHASHTRIEDDGLQDIFNHWVDNHHSLENENIETEKALIGLYSFCKLNEIKIIIMNNNFTIFDNMIDESDIVFFDKKNDDGIHSFCVRNELTIFDEMNIFMVETNDKHPGFFGHIEYAKRMAYYLGWNEKLPDFPIYSKPESIKKFLL